MTFALLFVAAFGLDVAYAHWAKSVTSGKPLQAALASMAIGAAGLLGVSSVLADHWLAVPWILGLGVGSWFGSNPDARSAHSSPDSDH